MTDVVVAFPWRPTPDRIAAFDMVRSWYRHTLPDAHQLYVDSNHQPFARAASRNKAVRKAAEFGANVVVVSDADAIPTPAGIHAAIDAARAGGLHYPFDQYLYAGTDNKPDGNTGGIYVCRPDVWESFGGMDERFTGWGGEDDAAYHAAACLVGEPTCHPGFVVSLWHDGACRDVGSVRWKPNSDLAMRYFAARSDPQRMRCIIAERSQ